MTEGEVTIHASELRQVFNNLISNAIDATDRNGSIELTVQGRDPQEVVVMVRDTGCGIPVEHLETIYRPFFTTKGEKGTGIGLWVVKGIVERLGGRILVETSTTGQTGIASRLGCHRPRRRQLRAGSIGRSWRNPLVASNWQLAPADFPNLVTTRAGASCDCPGKFNVLAPPGSEFVSSWRD